MYELELFAGAGGGILAQQLLGRKDIRAAYMPQNYEDALPAEKTPCAYLAELTGDGSTAAMVKIRTCLGSVKFTAAETEHPVSALSGGQKAKLMFIKMILQESNVLILDEPTRNFSPLSNPVIRDILREFRGCIISVSHDRKYMEEVCSTLYGLTAEGFTKIW